MDASQVPPPEIYEPRTGLVTYRYGEQRLCLSRLSVRRLVEAGHIRTVRFGRDVRLRGDDIEKLIEAGGIDSDRLAT